MIPGNGGWQTTIADLALILFMVSVAAIANQPEGAGEADQADHAAAPANPLPAMGEPAAIYRGGAAVPALDRWLADQTPDSRQQLTVIARYPSGGARDAAGAALELADQARAAGYRARILLEPAPSADVVAVLSYDGAGNGE